MKLLDVYGTPGAIGVLWRLLEERPKSANISHREMPTQDQHRAFVESRPYAAWYLIPEHETASRIVGAVYLTHDDEIGVSVFRNHKGRGHGQWAVKALMEAHPRDRYCANINPMNQESITMFGRLGFIHIQNTYEFNA